MAKLSFRQVEAFRAVMIAGTTTGAAEILYISQPAVSRLLSDFEDSVKVPLFERQKKRLIPTPEAQILFEEIERSFVGIEKLARTAEELRAFHRGTLRIASMPALAHEFLPRISREFMELNQGISMTLQVRSSQQVVDWIATQHFDIGFSAIAVSDPAIKTESLARSELVCILPPGHTLKNKVSIEPQDLEGEVFISLGTEQSIRYKVDDVFEHAEVNRKMLFDTQVSHVACNYVLSGSGVSLVDPITAISFIKQGLVVKPFAPSIRFNYNLIYPATRPASQLAVDFFKLLKIRLQELSDNSEGLFNIVIKHDPSNING
ncbi:LysR substrate-binding domain-containing protein [Amphritea sp. 1_MG-2023]|uniref:LysR substrate-binding domain-containing protein n=1 Tax=Amphritea sp. 1_MG-2023 TaxID=3062670 RepID=UPI0026E2C27C|nr:LysR substrate-binding domain-containing protein [Amphritea sp. 1_MG-2023]MDO6561989.1 LysR substrate-binding domain-containing protein [Amphritea sp. 1_MG-2023]